MLFNTKVPRGRRIFDRRESPDGEPVQSTTTSNRAAASSPSCESSRVASGCPESSASLWVFANRGDFRRARVGTAPARTKAQVFRRPAPPHGRSAPCGLGWEFAAPRRAVRQRSLVIADFVGHPMQILNRHRQVLRKRAIATKNPGVWCDKDRARARPQWADLAG